MRGEIWTGCVTASSPWNEELPGLDTRRGRIDEFLMSGIVVITLQQPFIVGARSNDRNALDGGGKWQDPVVTQQDGRFGDGLTSQRTLLRNLGLEPLLRSLKSGADTQALEQLVDPRGLGRIGAQWRLLRRHARPTRSCPGPVRASALVPGRPR